MKRFFVYFAVLTAFILAVSCDDGVKFNNPNDPNADISDPQNDEEKDSTDSVADEDPNEQADTENDENSDQNDTTADDDELTDDNADSGDDEDFIDPDVTDTGETVGETRVADCTGLPENASWNTVSAIVQTWNGEKWVPSSVASFNLEGSEDECHFKCDTNYGWNGSVCSADVKNAYCDTKPDNSVWNDGGRSGTFAQTWDGTSWTPANHAAVYSKSAVECGFVCATGYIWDGSACEVAPTQTVECTGLPLVGAEWNTASTITQTWDGEKWIPESTTGVYNENPSSEECRFKCKEHYTWKNSQCTADKKNSPCMNLPTNGQWNTVNSIEQTWSGSDWQPSTTGVYNETASTKECRFVCKTNYKWNASTSKCDPETNVANCTGKPENSVWNGSGKFEQTWTDSGWYPASYEATYNKTAGTCTFICDTGFIWDETSCVSAPTREAFCQDKQENTVWNTVDKITQTYNGADWEPSTTPIYNEEASTKECRFKCASEGYTWNGSSCTSGGSSTTPCNPNPCLSVANSTQECSVFGGTTYKCECTSDYYWDGSTCGTTQTQTAVCTGLVYGAEWNTVSEIIQTWDENYGQWVPSNEGAYNVTASTNRCRYKCKNNYFWNGSFCKNQSVISFGICTGQNKCYNNSSEITCPTSSTADFFGQDAWYASLGKCIPHSFTVQTISNKKVVLDNNTGLIWQQTIPTDKYKWDNAVSYCNGLSYAGYNDWRLPTPQEFLTIVDNSRDNPAIDTTYFPNTPSGYFWSSSTYVSDTNYAWNVNFHVGNVLFNGKSNTNYVRCVR